MLKPPGTITPVVRAKDWVLLALIIQLLKIPLVFLQNFSLLFKILDEMSDYWLISVPGDAKEGHPSWEMIKTKIGALSNIWRFHIPSDLKVSRQRREFIFNMTSHKI